MAPPRERECRGAGPSGAPLGRGTVERHRRGGTSAKPGSSSCRWQARRTAGRPAVLGPSRRAPNWFARPRRNHRSPVGGDAGTGSRWYLQWLDDIRMAPEIPAEFRSWSDYEDQTATLRAWTPTILDGLVQVGDHAVALIATEPGITSATADRRLQARMARQQRVLHRKQPPRVALLVDELSLLGK
jgi:hypothetical protein